MKPKTLAMAVPTMVAIFIGFGALFFYIEETKYEALVYKKELDKLRADSTENRGLNLLIEEIAKQSPGAALTTLYRSNNLNNLSADEMASIVASQQSSTLTHDELNAVKQLVGHD